MQFDVIGIYLEHLAGGLVASLCGQRDVAVQGSDRAGQNQNVFLSHIPCIIGLRKSIFLCLIYFF